MVTRAGTRSTASAAYSAGRKSGRWWLQRRTRPAPAALRRQQRPPDPARNPVKLHVIGTAGQHALAGAGDRERATRQPVLSRLDVQRQQRVRARIQTLHLRPEAPVAQPD